MTSGHATLVERVDEIRATFDRSFAEPLHTAPARFDHVLAIRVAGQPYAVRLGDLAGVHVDWPVTPVPSVSRGLLGIAGFQGCLVPVYDLGVLLDVAGPGAPRWVALTAGTNPVAFAFDGLDGHLRVAPEVLAGGTGTATGGAAVVRWAGAAWAVVSLPELVDTLRSRLRGGRPSTVARDMRSDE
jgi:purine-binding chemotaxis protein CheW